MDVLCMTQDNRERGDAPRSSRLRLSVLARPGRELPHCSEVKYNKRLKAAKSRGLKIV